MYPTFEAVVEPSGRVRLLEVLQLDRPCRAFVTLLTSPDDSAVGAAGDILRFLEKTPLAASDKLTAQQIDAQIEAQRCAWD